MFVVEPFVFGPAFVMQLYASFLVWHYLPEEEKTGCFTFLFLILEVWWFEGSSPNNGGKYTTLYSRTLLGS